jgi:Tol biopolymer transport system component
MGARTGIAAALALGGALLVSTAAAQTISAEAFGRLPDVADVSISPDGRRVALARNSLTAGGAVGIMEIDNPANQTGYRVGPDTTLRDVRWADDGRVVYYSAAGGLLLPRHAAARRLLATWGDQHRDRRGAHDDHQSGGAVGRHRLSPDRAY